MNSVISPIISSIRGLPVSSSLCIPVSSVILSLTDTPGYTRVEYFCVICPPSTLAIPTSIILSTAGLRPVVSMSSATYLLIIAFSLSGTLLLYNLL